MLGATSIWFVKVYNVTEVLRVCWKPGDTDGGLSYLTVFFTFVVPVAFPRFQLRLGRVQLGWVVGRSAGAGSFICGASSGSSRCFHQCFQLKEEQGS